MKTFEELGIMPQILKAVDELGFQHPMPVQSEVIPLLLSDTRDIIALAQTGTGKTAAFGIPIIQKTDTTTQVPQTLVLCPTRELCLQIAGDLSDLSVYVERIKILPVYGGSSIESQIRALTRGVHIIVATPGRLIDLIKRGTVSLENVRTVVLDEADEMLNMGFSEDIDEILSNVPDDRGMLLFSATMPQEIAKITREYMNEPVEITIGRKNEGATNVRHIYFIVHPKDKYLALKRVVDYYPNIYGIVFCRTRKETQEVADNLMKDGYNADSLHGDLSQAQRDHVMNKFRNRNLQLLVATDVAARGLDVESISHIINYGLPEDNDIYTHRSGRTGRAGKTGISISLVHPKEKGKIGRIEKVINKRFEKRQIPSGDAICEKQLFNFVDKIEKVKVNEAEIERLLPSIFRKLEWLEKEDIIKRVVSLEFNRLIDYYQQAIEIHEPSDSIVRKEKGFFSRKPKEMKGNRQPEKGYSRLFINVGKVDGVNPAILMGFINDHVRGKVPVGKINVMNSFSLFEVPEGVVGKVLKSFTGMYLEDRKLVVRLDDEELTGGKRKAKGDRSKWKKSRADQRKHRK